MTAFDNSVAGENLVDFFKKLDKKGPNVSKNTAKNVFKKSGPALETGANVGIASASRSAKLVLSSLPEVINLSHTGMRLCPGKLV